jgi:phage terminase large subunit-like protein
MTTKELGELKVKRKKLALKDLLLYSGPDPEKQFDSISALARILGYTVFPVHEKIIRHQNKTQFGDALSVGRSTDMTLAFRGLGKSSIGTIVRAVAYVIRDVNVRLLVASDTAGAAVAFHKEIGGHLRYNKTLVDLFGAFYNDNAKTRVGRYSDKESTILQRKDKSIKEATISTLGIGGQGASMHFDVVLPDDLVTLTKSRTAAQRRLLSDWHGSTLVGTFLPHTRIHYSGTRYYPHDLWDDLEGGREDESVGRLANDTLRIQMVNNYLDPPEEWEPTHGERYPKEICLERLQAMGRYHFQAQMQQDTRSGEGIIFSYADFRWYDESENAIPENAIYFQYSDLAAKKTESGDFHVTINFAVADVDGERRIWVADMIRMRGGLRKQRQTIINQIAKWKPVRAGVEGVAMQVGFAEEIAEGTMLPVRACPEGRNKMDKESEARRVSYLVEGNKVYLPIPESAMGRRTKPLIDELTIFPDTGTHDDTVDAFVGGLDLISFGDFFTGLGDWYAEGTTEAVALNGAM